MGAIQIYQLAQNRKLTVDQPTPLGAIAGDNATNFYLFFPGLPPGMQWVFPFIYGFCYPLPAPHYRGFLVDASMFPSGAAAPALGGGQLALLTAYSPPGPGFSPGVPATGATLTRWNINSLPGAGIKASVTRAATAGVTHLADSFWASMGAATAAPGSLSGTPQIIDGPSGGALKLWSGGLFIQAVAGSFAFTGPVGPGANYRGTAGNAMTTEFTAANANVSESVNLAGIDQ